MANNTSDVVVAGTGSVHVAPENTTMPIDLVTPLPAAWLDVGYVSEDGVAFTFDRTQEEINAWQSSTPVRVLVTQEPISVAFELLQFDKTTMLLAFRGGAVAGSTAPWTYTPPNAGATDVRALVIDAVDGSYHFRWGFPRVSLSEAVEYSLLASDALRLPLTFAVLASSAKWSIISDHPGFNVSALAASNGGGGDTSSSTSKTPATATA